MSTRRSQPDARAQGPSLHPKCGDVTNNPAQPRYSAKVIVHIDGGDTFIVVTPHRTVVAILGEDLSEAVCCGDRVRYDEDMRALRRMLAAFGSRTERVRDPDIVLPRPGTDLVAARAVVRIRPDISGVSRTRPTVLLFASPLGQGETS